MIDLEHIQEMPDARNCEPTDREMLILARAHRAEAKVRELEEAIRGALRISDLWTYHSDVPEQLVAEAEALASMKVDFEGLLKNGETVEISMKGRPPYDSKVLNEGDR